jgi:hypothetical protein
LGTASRNILNNGSYINYLTTMAQSLLHNFITRCLFCLKWFQGEVQALRMQFTLSGCADLAQLEEQLTCNQ